MDPEKKLKLMKKYDFDFINKLTNLNNYVFFLTQKGNTKNDGESYIVIINKNYQQISDWYMGINFKEINKEIDGNEKDKKDFATLFKVRELLPQLRQTIDEYIAFARNHQYSVPEDKVPYQRVEGCIKKMLCADAHNGVRYRDRIKNLENRLY